MRESGAWTALLYESFLSFWIIDRVDLAKLEKWVVPGGRSDPRVPWGRLSETGPRAARGGDRLGSEEDHEDSVIAEAKRSDGAFRSPGMCAGA